MSFAATLLNRTGHTAERFVLPTAECQEAVLIVVNAAFIVSSSGALVPDDEPCPVEVADRFNGEPGSSSLAAESQLALSKTEVDVLVSGHAYAPAGHATTECVLEMRVGMLVKSLLAVGDREWRRGLLGREPSAPRPFVRIPLEFERCFGGSSGQDVLRENPVGVGFKGVTRPSGSERASDLPNFEYPHARQRAVDQVVPPAGCCTVGRDWLPRAKYAGTYDSRWLRDRWPLLPEDFDPRHNQCAPADQRLPRLVGGEPVLLSGFRADGPWHLVLPRVALQAKFRFDRQELTLPMPVDTLLLQPDSRRVVLTCRASATLKRRAGPVREIELGTTAEAGGVL